VPLNDQRLEFIDLRFHRVNLGGETTQRCASQRGYLGVLHPNQIHQKIGDPADALGGGDAELGEAASSRWATPFFRCLQQLRA